VMFFRWYRHETAADEEPETVRSDPALGG
jgi:hypothetical protein